MKTTTIEEIKEKIAVLKALAIVVKGTVIEEDINILLENYSNDMEKKKDSVYYRRCYISRDTRYGKYKIYAGGYVTTSFSASTSSSIIDTWKKLKKEGYFNDDGLILKDITGYSASTTISIIVGCNASGPKVLKEILWE